MWAHRTLGGGRFSLFACRTPHFLLFIFILYTGVIHMSHFSLLQSRIHEPPYPPSAPLQQPLPNSRELMVIIRVATFCGHVSPLQKIVCEERRTQSQTPWHELLHCLSPLHSLLLSALTTLSPGLPARALAYDCPCHVGEKSREGHACACGKQGEARTPRQSKHILLRRPPVSI